MIDSYWQAQVFSGRNSPPKSMESDQAIIDYVRTKPGAVAYISSTADTEGVKVITVQE
jgi:hypothetical protein